MLIVNALINVLLGPKMVMVIIWMHGIISQTVLKGVDSDLHFPSNIFQGILLYIQ